MECGGGRSLGPSTSSSRHGVRRSAVTSDPGATRSARLSAVTWPKGRPQATPRIHDPGASGAREGEGGTVPIAQSGTAALCRAIRPAAAPPLSTNHCASAINAAASPPRGTATPVARPSARRISAPSTARSMRKSPVSTPSARAAPASMTNPTLPGSSGREPRRAIRSQAMRWVSSFSCHCGATRIVRRCSRAASAATRSSAIRACKSGCQPSSDTPRSWRLARDVRSITPLP
ncbi:hypothetical protein D9M73_124950 [compost metagenome]